MLEGLIRILEITGIQTCFQYLAYAFSRSHRAFQQPPDLIPSTAALLTKIAEVI
jgi:hypothetical protein